MIRTKNITGIILAGGKSSRMGTDKGLLEINQKPFVTHIADALQPLVSEIMIVSDNSKYDVFGYRRILDVFKDSGPLDGVYSGLKASKTEYNLVLSCDIPLIKTIVLKQLIDSIDATNDVFQIESNGKTMPLVALYKKTCFRTFQELLVNHEKRLQFAVNQCKVKNIKLKHRYDHTITNVNTKQEFKLLNYEH
ncbi:molybdenum cofactor guanylyltransferase [Aestuariivivens sediminis]|uniref:molybdenum cofactor guanylyltransferase n=1 Tax=Aestuariivivens sediminis TaxID=2913557 RepID=UPI001F5674F1|nr:molybdenum cofactor guanylyltransferase [Aestuariivivens sediminis]